jgi:phage terminase small subunit
MALTPKHQRFVTEYLVDLNGTQAAIRAGFAEKSARVTANRLLTNHNIQAAIEAGKKKREAKVELTAERILQEYKCLAFSDIGEIVDFSGPDPRLRPANEIPEAARRAISKIKLKRYTEGNGESAREVEVVEFSLWGKREALDKLKEHVAMPTPPQVPIQVQFGGIPGGTPIGMEHGDRLDLSRLSDDELNEYDRITAIARGLPPGAVPAGQIILPQVHNMDEAELRSGPPASDHGGGAG